MVFKQRANNIIYDYDSQLGKLLDNNNCGGGNTTTYNQKKEYHYHNNRRSDKDYSQLVEKINASTLKALESVKDKDKNIVIINNIIL